MATLNTYLTQVQRLLHDANNAIWTPPELTDYINEARDQTCRDTDCLRLLQTSYVHNAIESFQYGTVTGVFVVSGGANYTLPPVVTLLGGGFSAQATVTASISGGAVTGVTLTNVGAGYTSAPTVSIVNAVGDTTGSGATLAAGIISANTLKLVNVTVIYGNTRYMMWYFPFSKFTGLMRPWTNWFQRPEAWTDYGQSGFIIGPQADQVYPVEFDTCITPNSLVVGSDIDQISNLYITPVQYYAAYKAKLRQQALGEANYFRDLYTKEAMLVSNQVFMHRIPEPQGAMWPW